MCGRMKLFRFDFPYRAALVVTHSPVFYETTSKGAYPRPCQTQISKTSSCLIINDSKTSSSLIINTPPVCCCRLQLGPPYFGATGGREHEFCFTSFHSIQAERADHAMVVTRTGCAGLTDDVQPFDIYPILKSRIYYKSKQELWMKAER